MSIWNNEKLCGYNGMSKNKSDVQTFWQRSTNLPKIKYSFLRQSYRFLRSVFNVILRSKIVFFGWKVIKKIDTVSQKTSKDTLRLRSKIKKLLKFNE